MLFKLNNAKKVEREGFTAFLYNLKSKHPEFNTVYVDCFGAHEKCYVKTSHRMYFVIEGNGKFYFGNEKYEVAQNDVVVIEPMKEYLYEGKMKLFEVNFPATDSSDEVDV